MTKGYSCNKEFKNDSDLLSVSNIKKSVGIVPVNSFSKRKIPFRFSNFASSGIASEPVNLIRIKKKTFS
jgi:hypothetical protein